MVLILSYPNDQSAERILFFLRKNSIPCTMVHDPAEIAVTLVNSRHGKTRCKIFYRGTAITGIINRSIWLDKPDTPSFWRNEQLAFIWSAIALFDGPVINRPSIEGFIPQADSCLLTIETSFLTPSPVVFSNQMESSTLSTEERSINVHTICEHNFLGRLTDGIEGLNDIPFAFTSFSEKASLFFLVAGESLFSLGKITDEQLVSLEPLLDEVCHVLKKKQANFSFFVLQADACTYSLLHSTPFPHYRYYQHCEELIYQSLTNYLGYDLMHRNTCR